MYTTIDGIGKTYEKCQCEYQGELETYMLNGR